MGHCIESGYGIVTEGDRLVVLDTAATPHVVDAVEGMNTEEGIRLRVTRERQDEQMETKQWKESDAASQQSAHTPVIIA